MWIRGRSSWRTADSVGVGDDVVTVVVGTGGGDGNREMVSEGGCRGGWRDCLHGYIRTTASMKSFVAYTLEMQDISTHSAATRSPPRASSAIHEMSSSRTCALSSAARGDDCESALLTTCTFCAGLSFRGNGRSTKVGLCDCVKRTCIVGVSDGGALVCSKLHLVAQFMNYAPSASKTRTYGSDDRIPTNVTISVDL